MLVIPSSAPRDAIFLWISLHCGKQSPNKREWPIFERGFRATPAIPAKVTTTLPNCSIAQSLPRTLRTHTAEAVPPPVTPIVIAVALAAIRVATRVIRVIHTIATTAITPIIARKDDRAALRSAMKALARLLSQTAKRREEAPIEARSAQKRRRIWKQSCERCRRMRRWRRPIERSVWKRRKSWRWKKRTSSQCF